MSKNIKASIISYAVIQWYLVLPILQVIHLPGSDKLAYAHYQILDMNQSLPGSIIVWRLARILNQYKLLHGSIL